MSTGPNDRLKVDYDALARARTKLTDAATALAGTGDSSPGAVDAGDMTGPVAALIAAVSDSAAGLAEGLHAAGQKLSDNAVNYAGSDENAASRFRVPPGMTR